MMNSDDPLPARVPTSMYRVALVICVVVSAYGFSIGRPMLQTGAAHFGNAEVLRFPYPLSTALIQSFATSILTLFCGCALFFVGNVTKRHPRSYELIPRQHAQFDNHNGFEDEQQVQNRAWCRSDVLHLVALATLLAGDLALTNYVLCFAPLEIFVVSRALVLPISILVSTLLQTKYHCSPSAGNIWVSLLLSLGIVLAAYRFDLPWPSRAVWGAFFSAFLAAFWPLFVQISLHYGSGRDTADAEPSKAEKSSDILQPMLALWKQMFYASLIATAILLGVVLASDELGNMRRNFYIYDSVPPLVLLQAIVAILRFALFCTTFLLVAETCAATATFLVCFAYGSQISILTFSDLLASQKAGIAVCVIAGACYLWNYRLSSLVLMSSQELATYWPVGRLNVFTLRRIVYIFLILVTGFFAISLVFSGRVDDHSSRPVLLPSTPERDAYLGVRPSLETIANLDLLVEKCRGSPQLENLRDVRGCIDYLATQQGAYFDGDEKATASTADGSVSNTPQQAQDPSVCKGKIILYHVWWTGAPSWRAELFVKAYLSTQMLACSRLWIWLNADVYQDTVADWLGHPNFVKFLPFVNDREISLKEWHLPSRVPVSPDLDPLDKARYYSHPRPANSRGEVLVADSIIRDASGQEFIQFYEPGDHTQLTFFTVASSDAARLIILHLHGGVYLDIDMLLLRDMRPLILPGRPFSERWGGYADPTMYNNAVLALPANSTMSSYILTGGTRMGLTYHFMNLGRMMVQEGRSDIDLKLGFLKLESAFFDPIWPGVDNMSEGRCLVPCLKSFEDIFTAQLSEIEWSAYDGKQAVKSSSGNNRTMENFFRGAWAYHIHNQWHAVYERGSWMDVVMQSHDRFFGGTATNAYGEYWTGKSLSPYNVSTA